MRLAIPTLILFLYIFFSLILRLECRPLVKAGFSLFFFAAGLKFIIYERIGGSFIAPDFSSAVLLLLEFCYSFMLILVFLLLIKDLAAFFLFISRLFGSEWQLPLSAQLRAVLLTAAAFCLASYGMYQALRVPGVKTREIFLQGLPAALDGFTVVQLTDMHIGLLLHQDWVAEVVRRTNGLKPDMIVLTGDLIDGLPVDLQTEIEPLRELKAPYGVYGVTGNHEYYFGAQEWIKTFRSLGVDMLTDEFRVLQVAGSELVIAGVNDSRSFRRHRTQPDFSFMKNAPAAVTILLQHRPDIPSIQSHADLQISGHTHGGHLFFSQTSHCTFQRWIGGGTDGF